MEHVEMAPPATGKRNGKAGRFTFDASKLMNDDGTDTSELINKLKNKFAKDKAPNKMQIASNSQSSESHSIQTREFLRNTLNPNQFLGYSCTSLAVSMDVWLRCLEC